MDFKFSDSHRPMPSPPDLLAEQLLKQRGCLWSRRPLLQLLLPLLAWVRSTAPAPVPPSLLLIFPAHAAAAPAPPSASAAVRTKSTAAATGSRLAPAAAAVAAAAPTAAAGAEAAATAPATMLLQMLLVQLLLGGICRWRRSLLLCPSTRGCRAVSCLDAATLPQRCGHGPILRTAALGSGLARCIWARFVMPWRRRNRSITCLAVWPWPLVAHAWGWPRCIPQALLRLRSIPARHKALPAKGALLVGAAAPAAAAPAVESLAACSATGRAGPQLPISASKVPRRAGQSLPRVSAM